jgi:hypothetical protein
MNDAINDLIEEQNLKLQKVEEISRQMKELGLSFVAQDWQISGLIEQFKIELEKLKTKL